MGALDEMKGETVKTVGMLAIILGGVFLLRLFFISVWLLLVVVVALAGIVWFVGTWWRSWH